MAILLVIAGANGWRPSWIPLGAALAGFALIFLLLVGLGLIFSTFSVYFRDAEQIVGIVTARCGIAAIDSRHGDCCGVASSLTPACGASGLGCAAGIVASRRR